MLMHFLRLIHDDMQTKANCGRFSIKIDFQTQCMIEEVKRIRETLKSDEKNRKGSRQNSGNYEEYNTGHRFSLTRYISNRIIHLKALYSH